MTESYLHTFSQTKQNEITSPTSKDLHTILTNDAKNHDRIFNKKPTAATPEFRLFSKLPTELRLMIWEQALPGPRLVDVDFHFRNKLFSFGSELMSLTSTLPHPTLLSVCTESRAVAKNRYKLSFAAEAGKPKIYFDENVDTLYIPFRDTINVLTSLSAVDAFESLSFNWLRHLALGLGPDVGYFNPVDYVDLVLSLGNLETFTIMCQDEEDDERRGSWQDKYVQEVDAENEPEGVRQSIVALMEKRSPWLPGSLYEAPVVKFGKVSEK
jgi:hypothetical protein